MLFLNSRECGLEIIGAANFQGLKFDPQSPSCNLHLSQQSCVGSVSRIPEDPTRVTLGNASLSSSSCFPLNSERLDNPVTFPPGCARLVTSPVPTGSVTLVMTMGIVVLAFLAAWVAVVPLVKMTSTLRCTSSAA